MPCHRLVDGGKRFVRDTRAKSGKLLLCHHASGWPRGRFGAFDSGLRLQTVRPGSFRTNPLECRQGKRNGAGIATDPTLTDVWPSAREELHARRIANFAGKPAMRLSRPALAPASVIPDRDDASHEDPHPPLFPDRSQFPLGACRFIRPSSRSLPFVRVKPSHRLLRGRSHRCLSVRVPRPSQAGACSFRGARVFRTARLSPSHLRRFQNSSFHSGF